MKRLAVVAFAMITVGINLVSMPASGKTDVGVKPVLETQHQTVIQNGRVLAKLPRIPKPKIFRSNPYRLSVLLKAEDDNDIDIDDESKITGYRKRDLNKIEHKDGISPYARWRLFLARQLALLKYREKWAVKS